MSIYDFIKKKKNKDNMQRKVKIENQKIINTKEGKKRKTNPGKNEENARARTATVPSS